MGSLCIGSYDRVGSLQKITQHDLRVRVFNNQKHSLNCISIICSTTMENDGPLLLCLRFSCIELHLLKTDLEDIAVIIW